ncbi:hypothetical protein ABZZ36_18355 [Actinacidiphila glaucinigra]|uniref:hypothetical protein n=1 Tax=Actinacidiphila glaucinigra TaxID=235986 RepID=UPI0033AD38E4
MAVARLVAAVQSGDRRRALEAIRDRLAKELQDAEGRDVAPIANQLRATIAELDALPGGKEVSPVDEFTARLEARRAEAAGS